MSLATLKKESLEKINDFPVFNIQVDPKFTPRAKRKRIDATRTDAFGFVKEYAIGIDPSFNAMHYWMEEHFFKNGIHVVAGSRKFAKTWFMKWKELQIVSHQLREYPAIISDTLELAYKNIYSIENIAKSEKYELLQYDYELASKIEHPKKGEGVSINGVFLQPFSLLKGTRGSQGGETGFSRLDFVAVDDFENIKNTKNPELNNERLRILKSEIFPALSIKNRNMMILGNRIREDSAVNQLIKEMKKEKLKNYIVFPCFDKNKESNWKKVISTESLLEDRATMGEILFRVEMLQEVINGNGYYSEKDLKYDDYRHFKDKIIKVIQYHDPAFSIKTTGCFKACVTLGIDAENTYYLLKVRLSKHEYDQFLYECYEDYRDFSANIFFYENNGNQWDRKISSHWDKFEFKDQMSITDDYAEGNKIERIDAGLQLFKSQSVIINKSIKYDDEFLLWQSQFFNFPKPPFDGLDAFASGARVIKGFNRINKIYIPKKKPSFFEI